MRIIGTVVKDSFENSKLKEYCQFFKATKAGSLFCQQCKHFRKSTCINPGKAKYCGLTGTKLSIETTQD